MGTKYFLYNQIHGTQLNEISESEVLNCFKNEESLAAWLYWLPDMTDWQPAQENDELKMLFENAKNPPKILPPSLPAQKPPAPPPLQTSLPSGLMKKAKKQEEPILKPLHADEDGMKQYLSQDIKIVEFKSEETKIETYEEKRKHPRISGRLRTIITNQEKAFITYTKDISLGGVRLENEIPASILQKNPEVEIYISGFNGKESIVFRCRAVEDAQQSFRFYFTEENSKYKDKLDSWLKSLQEKQKAA